MCEVFQRKGSRKEYRGGKSARVKPGKVLPLPGVAKEEEPVERSRKEESASQEKTQDSPILEAEGEISFLVVLVHLVSTEQKIKEEVKIWTSSCLKTKDLLKFLALGHW